MTGNMTNGVNIEQLNNTVAAVQGQPELAKFQFRATNRWVYGGQNRSTIQGFYGAGQEDTTRTEAFVLDADEPPVLLGEDNAPNPAEFILHALIACITTSTVYHAAARGIKIEAMESMLEGEIDLHGFLGLSDSVRKGYQDIRVSCRIEADATPEQMEELKRLHRFSPIFDVVSNPVPVSVNVDVKAVDRKADSSRNRMAVAA